MREWLKVRGIAVIAGAVVVTVVGVALPGAAATAMPSPAGATLAAACFLALAPAVAVGWGCSRGDGQLEAVAVRQVHLLDLLLAALVSSLTFSATHALDLVGLAVAGSIAARAIIVYVGLMLIVSPLAGWRIATMAPAIYLLAVAIFGRGADIYHPATWAWIAAPVSDASSWFMTGGVIGVGLGVNVAARPYAVYLHANG